MCGRKTWSLQPWHHSSAVILKGSPQHGEDKPVFELLPTNV
jgi:hypothetical protein